MSTPGNRLELGENVRKLEPSRRKQVGGSIDHTVVRTYIMKVNTWHIHIYLQVTLSQSKGGFPLPSYLATQAYSLHKLTIQKIMHHIHNKNIYVLYTTTLYLGTLHQDEMNSLLLHHQAEHHHSAVQHTQPYCFYSKCLSSFDKCSKKHCTK